MMKKAAAIPLSLGMAGAGRFSASELD